MNAIPFWRTPWALLLAGGIVMGLSLGVRHVQGLFLLPVTMDHGWSRETFGFAIALQNLVWGLAQPFTGMIADRYGSARVIAAGLLCYAIGLALMATVHSPTAFTLSAGLGLGVALACTAFGIVYGALSRLVPVAKRSWALGVAGAIGGLGQFAAVPVSQSLIVNVGWATALLVLALVMALLLPLSLELRDGGQIQGDHGPQQTLRAALAEAFAHRGFWLLNLGFLTCGFQLAFITAHLPAYLQDKGLSSNDAVVGLALIALTNIFGTWYWGWLGGLRSRKFLLSGIYLIRSAVMALFFWLPLSPLSVYLFSAAMGFLWLGTVPLTNGLISQVFGVRYIATLFGFVFFGHQVGGFLGVWLGGHVFDATHSYDAIWYGAIGLGVVAALLHAPINDREIVRLQPAAA